MTLTSSFIHPSLAFIAVALLLPMWQAKGWRWLVLAPPIIAIFSVMNMEPGTYMQFKYLGVDLTMGRVDKLSVIFAHVFAIVSLIGFTYALHLKERYQHIAAALYVAGGFGCVFAGDLLTLFVFWELMSVGSVFLVWLNDNPTSTRAGFRYFMFHTLGGLFLLAGLLLRYADVGNFAFEHIAWGHAHYYDWLMCIGVCVNAAVVPLHAWLPDAYPEGSVTGSVFMSAFTTKTAVYVLARGFAGWEILAIMGTIMAVYGVCYATIENNARRILSYHIVSQVGYMVAGVGIGTAMTLNGSCAHAYAHILYKGLLFMGAGCLLYAAGTAKLTELGGLASRLPLVMICYMVAAVSISGMPFFNGFVSKTMTIAGAFEAHRMWLGIFLEVAAVGTFLSVGIKLPYFAFWSKPEDTKRELKPIPTNMYVAMILGASLCFLQGVYPDMLYYLLPYEVMGAAAHGAAHAAHAVPEPSQILAAFDVNYHPWEIYKVLQAFLLLGFTGLGFYVMRNVIKPHKARNLDFEWFYILGGKLVMWCISIPLSFLDALWTEAYRAVGLRLLLVLAKVASWFDWRIIDDSGVDWLAYRVRGVGKGTARFQSGRLQDYLAMAALLGLGIFALVWYLA